MGKALAAKRNKTNRNNNWNTNRTQTQCFMNAFVGQYEKVFSWGRGRDGRLGHGDYKDRWEPCRVGGLGPEPVALIAAGAAHSMAVSLPQSVHVWGRGYEGERSRVILL